MTATEKEKAGISPYGWGVRTSTELDRQCGKTYRSRALWLLSLD